MSKKFFSLPTVLLVAVWLPITTAQAEPIAVSNVGYWLSTVGENTINLAGGGSSAGVFTTVFIANTSPTFAQGTTATATLGGIPTSAPAPAFGDPLLWARRMFNPAVSDLQPLSVVFVNGSDTATVTTRDLRGAAAMPLVQSIAVDASSDPFGPIVSWSLPTTPGLDIDNVQLSFFSNVTNLEVATVVLPGTATSYDIIGPIPPGFDLTINVRLFDLADDSAPLSAVNILSESRTFFNYLTPVPEPSTALLLLAGMLTLALRPVRLRVLR